VFVDTVMCYTLNVSLYRPVSHVPYFTKVTMYKGINQC